MEDLQIFTYDGLGYDPTFHFGAWRVAFLNWDERFERVGKLERHMETDEVFVLLKGEATLVIGLDMKKTALEEGKIYNVPKAVWHAVLTSRDAKVLVVENDDTTTENSEYIYFDENGKRI